MVAVGHAEDTSPEPGAPKRVVIDSLRLWRGKRLRPVRIEEVESYLALTATRYSRAKILADPWQAAGMIQRLQAQGVRCEQFPFTTTSTGYISQALHLALKNHLIHLPNDEELLSELGRVRLRETGIGEPRLDHDLGDHDDQAVALAIIVADLIGNVQTSAGKRWLEGLVPPCPNVECQAPNVQGSVKCRVGGTTIEPTEEPAPYGPEPVAAKPWSPWSPMPQGRADPRTVATVQFVQDVQRAPWNSFLNRRS